MRTPMDEQHFSEFYKNTFFVDLIIFSVLYAKSSNWIIKSHLKNREN